MFSISFLSETDVFKVVGTEGAEGDTGVSFSISSLVTIFGSVGGVIDLVEVVGREGRRLMASLEGGAFESVFFSET